MASTPTTRNRLEKQGAGENSSTWGAPKLNTVIDLLDAACDGWTTKALTTNVTLTSTNYVADESRARILKFTGTGAYQVTIPSVEKWYIVANRLTGNVTLTTGAGTTIVVEPNETAIVICDGTNLIPLGYSTQSLKAYIDAKALPSQTSNAGKLLLTDGTNASWSQGAAYAFAQIDVVALVPTVTRGFGIASVSRIGAGNYSVFYTNTAPATPIVIVSSNVTDNFVRTASPSATGFSVETYQLNTSPRDNAGFNIVAYVP